MEKTESDVELVKPIEYTESLLPLSALFRILTGKCTLVCNIQMKARQSRGMHAQKVIRDCDIH
jgi:hypothetical protein